MLNMLSKALGFMQFLCVSVGSILLVVAIALRLGTLDGATVPAYAKSESKPDVQPIPDQISSCRCGTCRCKNPGDCGADGCNITDAVQEARDARVYLGTNGVYYFREDSGLVLTYKNGSWYSCRAGQCSRVR